MLLKFCMIGVFISHLIVAVAAEKIIFEDNFNSPDCFTKYHKENGARHVADEGRDGSGCLFFASDASNSSARAFLLLNPKKIQGKIRLSAWCRGEDVGHSAPWLGPKVMLKCTTASGGAAYPDIPRKRGTYDWFYSEIEFEIPSESEKLELTLGIQNCAGKVWIDDVKLELIAPREEITYVPYNVPLQKTPVLRGVMSGNKLEEKDFQDLKTWNVNFMRYQMLPPRSLDRSSREDFSAWIDSEIQKIDILIPRAQQNGIRLLLDLHGGPGTNSNAVRNNILSWNKDDQDTFVQAWERIARHYKNNQVIFGYDLLNEPSVAGENRDVPSWQEVAERTVHAIRAIDPLKPIIIEPSEGGSPQGFVSLRPIQAEHLIYSVHFYDPHSYTHQTDQLKEPIVFDGGKEYIRMRLAPVLYFQKKYNVPILVGEFSASAWAPDAHEYLRQCIEVFEEYGWDWVYHAFRESHWWDVELEGPMNNMKQVLNSLRKQVLLKSFSANHDQKP